MMGKVGYFSDRNSNLNFRRILLSSFFSIRNSSRIMMNSDEISFAEIDRIFLSLKINDHEILSFRILQEFCQKI